MRSSKLLEDLRDLSVEELQEREGGLSQQLFALRLQRETGQLESPAKMRQARRDLARVMTVQREKQPA